MKKNAGMTIMELMVATFILSVGVLAAIGSFTYISTSIQHSKGRTLATNLAQEQVEKLKNLSYYTLLVTTGALSDTHISSIVYDPGNYPPATIVEGGITFIRETRVDYAYQNGNTISTTSWNADDTAIKQISVFVLWQEGSDWKYQQVQNLFANPAAVPLDALADGYVKTPANAPLQNILVQVIDNTNWYGYTNSAGYYHFSVSPGSYTLQASSDGYYTSTYGYLNYTSNNTTSHDFQLSTISSGNVNGIVYTTDHLVISEVVASTVVAGNDIEYVQLYNPTTSAILIGSNGSVNSPNIWPVLWTNGNSASQRHLYYTVAGNSSIPAHGNYLITNSGNGDPATGCSNITINGATLTPDACWLHACYLMACGTNHAIQTNDAGGVSIANSNGYVAGTWPVNRIDSVAWAKDAGHPAPSNGLEGTQIIPLGGSGLVTGEIIGRMTDPGYVNSGYGMGYDSGDNYSNFLDSIFIPGPPNNSAIINPPRAGTPAYGATVAMNDLLGLSTTCTDTTVTYGTCLGSGGCHVCTYNLTAATGTWTMDVTSGSYYSQITNVTVQASVSTGTPNGNTSPTWVSVGNSSATLLSDTTTYAFISGRIFNSLGAAISGIRISDGNGHNTSSTANGTYLLLASTGNISLTANPNDGTMNRTYTIENTQLLGLTAGNMYATNDFTLELAGIIKGFFQTSSNTPLPRRVAVALKTTGSDTAQGASDNSGYFYLQNLSTGTYTVTPELDSMETASPTQATVVLASTGTTSTVSTFTITSGIAQITGRVLSGTATITTGALIVASTSTIASALPPSQAGATGASCNPCYYMASSDATGTYTLNVRSSASAYKVYGWYSTISNTTASVSKSNGGAAYNVSVTVPGQIGNQDITW